MFCITLILIIPNYSIHLHKLQYFLQNFFKNIFQKPIDKIRKICYSNRGSPSPSKKKNIHFYALMRWSMLGYIVTCSNMDIVLQATKLSSDGLLYLIRVYILFVLKHAQIERQSFHIFPIYWIWDVRFCILYTQEYNTFML